MEKFWKALEAELFARGIKTTRGNCAVARDGKYQISFPVNASDARKTRIHRRHLFIYPTEGVAHNIDVDEIWIGRDSEGCPWSDSMGGVRIDCTGLSVTTAVQKIADKMTYQFDEYFA